MLESGAGSLRSKDLSLVYSSKPANLDRNHKTGLKSMHKKTNLLTQKTFETELSKCTLARRLARVCLQVMHTLTEDLVWHVRPNMECNRHPPCVSLEKDAGQETWESLCQGHRFSLWPVPSQSTEWQCQASSPAFAESELCVIGHCESNHLLSWCDQYQQHANYTMSLDLTEKGFNWTDTHKGAVGVLNFWTFWSPTPCPNQLWCDKSKQNLKISLPQQME